MLHSMSLPKIQNPNFQNFNTANACTKCKIQNPLRKSLKFKFRPARPEFLDLDVRHDKNTGHPCIFRVPVGFCSSRTFHVSWLIFR